MVSRAKKGLLQDEDQMAPREKPSKNRLNHHTFQQHKKQLTCDALAIPTNNSEPIALACDFSTSDFL
jgi:hypothetical protein